MALDDVAAHSNVAISMHKLMPTKPPLQQKVGAPVSLRRASLSQRGLIFHLPQRNALVPSLPQKSPPGRQGRQYIFHLCHMTRPVLIPPQPSQDPKRVAQYPGRHLCVDDNDVKCDDDNDDDDVDGVI